MSLPQHRDLFQQQGAIATCRCPVMAVDQPGGPPSGALCGSSGGEVDPEEGDVT